jgi:hypothetical protein
MAGRYPLIAYPIIDAAVREIIGRRVAMIIGRRT